MLKISTFFLLVPLLPWIRAESSNVTEQQKSASRLQHENYLDETQDDTAITPAITEDNEDFDVNELEEISVEKNKYQEKNNNVSLGVQRQSRDADNRISHHRMECVSCYGGGISSSDESCYKGAIKTQECADAEECFTELNPQYIKRGCMLPSTINRTFVCKCPLCNDKPSNDSSYYVYKTIADWEYDNKRLQEPLVGLDLLCKVCETTQRNLAADEICRLGKSVDYMVCGHRELCYTNIDHQTGYVSRGCIYPSVYNSIHLFCNYSLCNNQQYENPARARREITFRTIPLVKQTSDSRTIRAHHKFVLINLIFMICHAVSSCSL